MKKTAAIFIVCVYALSSLGFSVKEFYCCGKLKSVTLSFHEDGNKECSKNESKDKCCKTKVQYLKVKQSHLASTILINTSHEFNYLPFCPSQNDDKIVTSIAETEANRSHAPPLHSGVAVYISNCVYRI